ncbi:hypothetical protein [Endomicrobium proavitum]|uniref:Uncharacterized protein n=1 Tax=Endomicrobium proavitum TaxID=1408281 RepID=A0A0G3WIQ6_9BACT|nr:hypothetical protein [Endomicrobium proavitum]AKL98198.1 membrane protein of unknown function [Endomicrobium proavitum]
MSRKCANYTVLKENILVVILWAIIYYVVLFKIDIHAEKLLCFVLTILMVGAIFKYLHIVEKKKRREKLVVFLCNFMVFVILAILSGFIKIIYFMIYMIFFWIAGISFELFQLITLK